MRTGVCKLWHDEYEKLECVLLYAQFCELVEVVICVAHTCRLICELVFVVVVNRSHLMAMASDHEEKTVLCFDANNWLDCIFWNNNADMEFIGDPWEALWCSDQTVGKFVRAARSSNYDLVAVASGGASSREARETYQWRREKEIIDEKRGVCLGAPLFLQESFEKRGVRVVRPIDADVNDVLAAIAETNGSKSKGAGAVIVSRNRCFFSYDRRLSVCRGFTVRGGKLILDPTVTRDDVWCPMRNALTVQPHFGLIAMADDQTDEENSWSQQGHANSYRPSLRKEASIGCGTTSSSDKRLGNLHSLARPLRAAVYASLGEHSALESIPEWNKDQKMVVWTETRVVADPTLNSLLKDPLSVVQWLEELDTAVVQQHLEPWRSAERMFNTCALAAELVAASSHGAWTMFKCMEIFSKDAKIINKTRNRIGLNISSSAPGSGTVLVQPTSQASQDARGHHALRQVSGTPVVSHLIEPMQHQIRKANPLPVSPSTSMSVAQTQAGTPPRARENIFGSGRPREQVLEERRARNKGL